MDQKLIDQVDARIKALTGSSTTQPTGVASGSVASYQYPPEPRVTMLKNTGFTGHGVTVNGTPTASNLNDTSDFISGTQSVSMTSESTAGAGDAFVAGLTSTDFTGRGLVFAYRVDNADTQVNKIDVQIISSNGGSWIGIVDGGVAETAAQKYAKSGEWIRQYVPFAALSSTFYGGVGVGTPDRTIITSIRLRFFNVTGQTVSAKYQFLGYYDEPATSFPNGVISLTYDDTYGSQFNTARLHLDKYGYRGTLYPILERIDLPNYLSLAQVKQLHDKSGWEVGAHATTVAQHALGLTGMTATARQAELTALRQWQVDNGFASDGPSFAYPRGSFDQAAIQDVSKYWQSARTVTGRNMEIIGTPYPYRLRSVAAQVVSGGMTLAGLKTYVDAAKASKCWTIFTVHALVSTVVDPATDFLTTDHQSLIDYIATQGVPVRTVREVMAAGATN